MKADKKNIPPGKLKLYDQLIQTNSAIERKGDNVPYTSLNGHMFTFLYNDGSMAIRLSKEERESFIKKYKTHLFEAYGVTQKEYVAVPEKLLKDTNELKKWLDLSFQYVKTLKPKPTKRGKSTSKRK